MTYPSQHAGTFYNWSQSNGFSFLYLITFRSVFNFQMSGGKKIDVLPGTLLFFLSFNVERLTNIKVS